MEVRLSLRVPNAQTSRVPSFEWSTLRTDNDLQRKYEVTIKNKYSALCTEDMSATEEYEAFTQANAETAAELMIPKKKGKKSRFDQNHEVGRARKILEQATLKYHTSGTRAARKILTSARNELHAIYTRLDEEELIKKIEKIETTHLNNQHSVSWKIINDITGRKTAPSGKLKGDNDEERQLKWYNHFKNLLGEPPKADCEDEDIPIVFENLNIIDDAFTMEELSKAKTQLSEGKAAGNDGIVAEVIKRINVDDLLLHFCNRCHMRSEKPEQWSHINLVPIPKSGDLGVTDNYRGISLTQVTTKLMNRLILNRIRPVIDPRLRPNQNGFRSGRSTTAQVLAI